MRVLKTNRKIPKIEKKTVKNVFENEMKHVKCLEQYI